MPKGGRALVEAVDEMTFLEMRTENGAIVPEPYRHAVGISVGEALNGQWHACPVFIK